MNLAVIAAIYSTVGWIGWIIIGGIAGWLAGKVVRGAGFGVLGDIVVGNIGGFVGGIILGLLVTTTVGFWGSLVTAFIGACILLFIVRLVTGGGRKGAFGRKRAF
jgi:uncharacterized membrane protein YeaQ/YmgE (transglycosylase-associated protein family)